MLCHMSEETILSDFTKEKVKHESNVETLKCIKQFSPKQKNVITTTIL